MNNDNVKYIFYKGGDVLFSNGNKVTEKEFKEMYPSSTLEMAVLQCYPHEIEGKMTDVCLAVDSLVRMKAEFGIISNGQKACDEYKTKQAEYRKQEEERAKEFARSIDNYAYEYANLVGLGTVYDIARTREIIQGALSQEEPTVAIDTEVFLREWQVGKSDSPIEYTKDFYYRYKDQVYKCIQTHANRGEEGWEPSVAKGLFALAHTKNVNRPKDFVRPTGVQDAYNKDECCLFEGEVYVSVMNANVWPPNEYPQGWELK